MGKKKRKSKSKPDLKIYQCKVWEQVLSAIASAREHVGLKGNEEPWYRGSNSTAFQLLPSLFWRTKDWDAEEQDDYESDIFFEFQARARQLHERGLSDWDYLFFMRHHGIPTRILDWTDAFGMALYFALDGYQPIPNGDLPCVWILNPYALNLDTWDTRDLVQPERLGDVEGYEEPWDYGDLLRGEDDWELEGPLAIYPLQISDRMRAQRGWFTFFGSTRAPLEVQYPDLVARIDLDPAVLSPAREFLDLAGLRPYSIYPDLDHLAQEVAEANIPLVRRST